MMGDFGEPGAADESIEPADPDDPDDCDDPDDDVCTPAVGSDPQAVRVSIIVREVTMSALDFSRDCNRGHNPDCS